MEYVELIADLNEQFSSFTPEKLAAAANYQVMTRLYDQLSYGGMSIDTLVRVTSAVDIDVSQAAWNADPEGILKLADSVANLIIMLFELLVKDFGRGAANTMIVKMANQFCLKVN